MMTKELNNINSLMIQEIKKIKDKRIKNILLDRIKDKGKQLRPLLYFLIRKELTGKILKEDLKIASGIELIHLASLIHDDIVDDSDTRRKKPSVHKKEGIKNAVIYGDLIFSISLRLFSNSKNHVMRSMINAIYDLSQGQIEQMNLRGNINITKKKYINIAEKKTASLFRLACTLAARNHKSLDEFREFGKHYGIAFQVKNDIADINEDLNNKELTLPLIMLRESTGIKKFKSINQKNVKTNMVKQDIYKNVDHYIHDKINLCKVIIDNNCKKEKKRLLSMLEYLS